MRVLIIGGGNTGRETARILSAHGMKVTLLDLKAEICERLSEDIDAEIFCGDALEPEVLENIDIENADVLIALTNNDHTNILTAMLAKSYGVKRIMIKVKDPTYAHACKKLRVGEIINPASIVASAIDGKLHGFDIFQLIETLSTQIELKTETVSAKSKFNNLTIEQALRDLGAHIIAILREGKPIIPNLEMKIKIGDVIFYLYKKGLLESISELFGRKE
ncbi:MAG: potassium channel family protein [Candidatus Odinarchaeia archaeon]